MATFGASGGGNCHAEVRRNARGVSEAFRRRKGAGERVLDIEGQRGRAEGPAPILAR